MKKLILKVESKTCNLVTKRRQNPIICSKNPYRVLPLLCVHFIFKRQTILLSVKIKGQMNEYLDNNH